MTSVTTGERGREGSLRDTPRADHSLLMRELERGIVLGKGGPVEVRQTHASVVFLTPSDVYKLKKPVDLGFLNYSTVRRRGRMCRAEVELNRRLAPSVYLGVERLTVSAGGRLQMNGRGRIVDYLVHMRRLDEEDALDGRLRAGRVLPADASRVGERIGRFHATAAAGPPAYGRRTFFRNARENLRALRSSASAFPQAVLAELGEYFGTASRRAAEALDARAADGRIREGHGDLRAEHVYLEDGVTIVDCVEFGRGYRVSDTALDFAFLVMDLVARGFPDTVEPAVQGYERAAGDSVGGVLPLYCWYRALVRAKVADILEHEAGLTDEERLGAGLDARRHLYHALRFARDDRRPVLVTVGGLPGSGKSTLARALGGATGAVVVCADEVRKRMAGLGAGEHPAAGIDEGLYSDEMSRRVYNSLVAAAERALAQGRSLILDATFRRGADREAARTVAARHGAQLLMVECSATEQVIRQRLRRRAEVPDAWSDASEATFEAHLATYVPPGREAGAHVVDTTIPLLTQVESVLWAQ